MSKSAAVETAPTFADAFGAFKDATVSSYEEACERFDSLENTTKAVILVSAGVTIGMIVKEIIS